MERYPDVALNALRNIVSVLNINIHSINIQLGDNSSATLTWKTKKGSYQIPTIWNGDMTETFVMMNTSIIKNITFNSFINNIFYSIIRIMIEQGDTDPIECFVGGLCRFWDPFFMITCYAPSYRLRQGLKELKEYVYKNPTAEMDPFLWFRYPVNFIDLVTSPLGNQIYYHCGLNRRPEMNTVRSGRIY